MSFNGFGEEVNGIDGAGGFPDDLVSVSIVRHAITRGEHVDLRYTVFRKGGAVDNLSDRIDLTDATAHWSAKLNASDTEAEISKSSAVVTEAVILAQGISDPTRGQYDVFIVPEDTAELPIGKHAFDTWIVLASAKQHAVITLGEIVIRREVTVLP